jgi:uncharacterized lipoprotein YajG
VTTFSSRPRTLILALLAAGTAFLTGCVSTTNVPIPQNRQAQLSGATLAVTERPIPAFADFKPSNAMFGMVGGLAAVGSGNELIRKYDIKDPAPKIGEALAQHLAAGWQVKPLTSVTVPIDTASVEEIAKAAAGKADLVLDVQTVNWSLFYLALKWNRYQVMYTVKLRLIDALKKELIAEGFHAWKTPESTGYSTHDELFADNAAVLRQRLDDGANAAIEAFRSGILKSPPQSLAATNSTAAENN